VRSLFSSGFQAGLTASFNLINTVRTSTSTLTTEVRKVVRAGADDRVLEALYSLPPGASGQNLRAFANQTNEQHEAALAGLWLFTVVGLYEVWSAELPVASSEVNCQFPTKGYNSISKKAGVGGLVGSLDSSPILFKIYGSTLSADPRTLDLGRLDDALAVYRLFKECRNSLAHEGGAATKRVEQWGTDVQARAADLIVDVQGSPVGAPQFTEGAPVQITFGQMRAFVSLLLRIVFTIDSAVLVSLIGEAEISRRWSKQFGSHPVGVTQKKLSRGAWIQARFAEIEVPVPASQSDLVKHLLSCSHIRLLP
jgi:hypothetical protein